MSCRYKLICPIKREKLSLLTVLCRPAGDGCGPTVLGPTSGTLSSLGYPWTYPNNSVCEWEITVPRGNRLHFRFAQLDIEDRDCQVNYLRLFDGIGPGRSEIGERAHGVVCGHQGQGSVLTSWG